MPFAANCRVPFGAFWCPESGLELTEAGRNGLAAMPVK